MVADSKNSNLFAALLGVAVLCGCGDRDAGPAAVQTSPPRARPLEVGTQVRTPDSVDREREAPTPATSATGPLVFGMATALTGPAAQLGLAMRAGVQAAFARANEEAGVRGRALALRVLDDGYEPERTTPAMEQLCADPAVLGIIGNVGTPTAIAALPIVEEHGILFYAAFTGAGILRREPPMPEVVNIRASYGEETAAMVAGLVEHGGIAPEAIGFFTQRDGYGDAGYRGGLAALRAAGLAVDRVPPHVRYERNTNEVSPALAELLLMTEPPRALIMVGAYEPCARLISLALESDYRPRFLNVSFVGTAQLAKRLGGDGDGVVITQVVPHPQADLPLLGEFRADCGSDASFGQLEGYLAGRILVTALRAYSGDLTREGVRAALLDLGEFDPGIGAPMRLVGGEEHQACHRVWPTVLSGGRVLPFQWSELGLEAAAPR